MNDQARIEVLPSALISQIEAVLQRDQNADCIALVSREALPQKEYRCEIADVEIRCLYCVSELAMREALIGHSGSEGGERLVLVAPFDVAHLAQDVLARIWRNEPQRLSPWRSLQQLLKVRDIDPRLTRKPNRWMADSLLSGYDKIRNKLTFGEILDLDGAWKAISLAHLGYSEGVVDLRSVLRWSFNTDGTDRLASAPDEVKKHLSEWLRFGDTHITDVVAGVLLSKHARDLMPLALACSVLYDAELERDSGPETAQFYVARGKFGERYLADVKTPPNTVLKALGNEAAALLSDSIKHEDYSYYSSLLAKTEQILISLDMTFAAKSTDFLIVSLQARFSDFAKSLRRALDDGDLNSCESAFENLKNHRLVALDLYRASVDRAKMAVRLARWLAKPPSVSGGAAQLISDYVTDGGFCDWARTEIWAGDSHDDLNDAYLKLAQSVRSVREQQNQAFGSHLDAVARGDRISAEIIPVEKAIDELVAPLGTGENARVLLLVLDGMSEAVYRQLNRDLLKHNWMEIQRDGDSSPSCLVAALPTITEVSRCSLLSGELREGRAADEKTAFAAHPALKRLASTRHPPVLFHKQDLSQAGSGSLNGDVRRVLAGREHRFVGVVINAIDDQLSSSAQVSVDWSFDSITLLRQVMDAARESGRTIIITSDHGHVLEHDSFFQQTETKNGERYWLAESGQNISATETLVTGDRVVVDGKSVVLPWSEQMRYVRGKNLGYHGGGSLQEVVIPLGVYVCASTEAKSLPEGWKAISQTLPEWWAASLGDHSLKAQESTAAYVSGEPKKKSVKTKREAVAELVDDMFSSELESASEGQGVQWIEHLSASPVYRQNRERTRVPVKDEDVLQFLNLLSRYQWQVMENQVVRDLNIPKIRLRGFLANIQRLLNVDGYPIVSVEREAQTVRLNVSDLRKQFELN